MGTSRNNRPPVAKTSRRVGSDATIAAHREQMMGRMLASILHEINNLLTPALTYCEMSKQDPEDASLACDAARHAYDAIVGVRDVAAMLLSLGRASPTTDGRASDLGSVLRSVASCAAPLARRRGVRLDIVLPPHTSVCVQRTPTQHIALNLILNAINATPRGGVVRLSAYDTKTQSGSRPARRSTWNDGVDMVDMSIEDSGPGIPANARRVLEGRTSRGPGGLGLRVCAVLARSMHAVIRVDRSPLGGGRVTVGMPTTIHASRARTAA